MKKYLVPILLVLLLLSACSLGTTNNTGEDNQNQDVNNNDMSDNQTDEVSDDTEDYTPASSEAVCTAQSTEVEVELFPTDHIKGAAEGYKYTIVEYGDFQ